jgi:glycosyltransferase involved in cell wall biosynthesis
MRNRVATARLARGYDVVYILRETLPIGPAFVERWLTRAGIPYIFDFDDAIFVPMQSQLYGRLAALRCAGKTATSCARAAQVIAGNEYLANYARRFNPNVHVVPTTIDTRIYAWPRGRRRYPIPTIGWSGSFSTVQYLDTLRPILQKLARHVPFRLLVIGARDYPLSGVEVEARPWSADSELEDLSEIDIGLMPLVNDAWARGKCGLKALQYMALAIPPVCSPVGVNCEIVQDGQNGFLANSPEEWLARLTLLLHNEQLRRDLGIAARHTVEARYSADVHAPRVADIIRQAAGVPVESHDSFKKAQRASAKA